MTFESYNPGYGEGHKEITEALVGKRIVDIRLVPDYSGGYRPYDDPRRGGLGNVGVVELDDGTVLELDGHNGGCACNAGCYALDSLASLGQVDNIITAVHFEEDPKGDGDGWDEEGSYKLFVVADDKRINLATFTGTDGNGYYGTGYYVRIAR